MRGLELFADASRQRQYWVDGEVEADFMSTYIEEVIGFSDAFGWIDRHGVGAGIVSSTELRSLREFYEKLERFQDDISFEIPRPTNYFEKMFYDYLRRTQAARPTKHVLQSDADVIALPEWESVMQSANDALHVLRRHGDQGPEPNR